MKKRGFTPLEIIRPRRGRMPCLWQGSPTGLTLIEILVALAILGMIAMALYGILKGGLDVWRGGKERTDIIAQARVAMDRLTREAREATWMEAADATSINFSAYLLDTTTLKDVSYYYDSAQHILYRNEEGVGGKEMAKYMDSFSLYYYSKWADNTINSFTPEAGSYNSIWMIEIEAKLKRGATGEEDVVHLRSTVQPRNYPYTQ